MKNIYIKYKYVLYRVRNRKLCDLLNVFVHFANYVKSIVFRQSSKLVYFKIKCTQRKAVHFLKIKKISQHCSTK